jgi:hypothetical protein
MPGLLLLAAGALNVVVRGLEIRVVKTVGMGVFVIFRREREKELLV